MMYGVWSLLLAVLVWGALAGPHGWPRPPPGKGLECQTPWKDCGERLEQEGREGGQEGEREGGREGGRGRELLTLRGIGSGYEGEQGLETRAEGGSVYLYIVHV